MDKEHPHKRVMDLLDKATSHQRKTEDEKANDCERGAASASGNIHEKRRDILDDMAAAEIANIELQKTNSQIHDAEKKKKKREEEKNRQRNRGISWDR